MGVPAQAWGRGFPFLHNLQAHAEATRCGSGNTSNQNWGGIIFDANSITNVDWGASFNPRPDYFPWSLVHPRAATRRVGNNLLHTRHQEHFKSPYNRRNPIANPQVRRRNDDREVQAKQ